MVQLSRLEGFYWVAHTGGYAKAARAFPYPITQPAVHQQVRKLEGEVGVPLFERAGKDRIVLSPAGRRLYELVAPFYRALDPLVRTLKDGDYGGKLRVHAGALFLRHLLPPWLRRLQRRHPDIRIDLRELLAPDCSLLEAGETDLLVSYLASVPAGVETRTLAWLYPFLVFPANHPLARRKRVSLRDLQSETFVSYTPGSLVHSMQMEILVGEGLAPRHVISTQTIDTILGFVESGVGYSLVPSLHVDGPRLKGVTGRPVRGPARRYEVVAAWRAGTTGNPLLEAALSTAPIA